MRSIGVLGGMGPAATLDFMSKLVALTPASRDQEHLPVIVANLPQTPDRSAAILGHRQAKDPLPYLRVGIELLNQTGVGVIAIPCNTSHHWYNQLSAISNAPILHIAEAALDQAPIGKSTLILATRGTLASGFYQRILVARKTPFIIPAEGTEQALVDECIRLVKAGQLPPAGQHLSRILRHARDDGVQTALLACTELPIAATTAEFHDLQLIDCTLELARRTVQYALERGWNRVVP